MSDFGDLHYGDEIVYVGPEDLPGTAVAPKDYKQPYTFRHVSTGGTLSCYTTFNGPKHLSPDHPANDPEYWEPA